MLQQRIGSTETPREGRFLLALACAALGSLALVASWLAPNHYPPWTSFHGEAAAFAALVFFTAARLSMPQPVAAGRIWGGVLLLALLAWSQWAAGLIAYLGDALVSTLYLVGAGFAWWLGANSMEPASRRAAVRWLAALVVAGAVLSVFIAMLQWLRMEEVLGIFAAERGPDARPYGNLAQPNHLGTLVLMATVFAWALYIDGSLKKWHFTAIVLWLAFGLTLSESRSALLAAVALGLLAIAKWQQAPARRRASAVGVWWALLLAMALAWPGINEALYLQPARDAQLTHDNARQVMWHQAAMGIAHAPWTGYGWRQSMIGQKAGATDVPGWLATDYAHNIVLDLLLWTGIPIGLFLAGCAGWWLLRTLRRLKGPDQVVLYGALLPFVVHSLFEFPFAYAYFLFPAAWMAGALARLQGLQAPMHRAARLVLAGLLAAFVAVGAAAALEYLVAEEDYRVMRFELRRVGKTPEGYSAPDLVLLTQLDELLKLGRIQPHPDMSARELERLGAGSRAFGWATLQLTYAAALGMNGKPQEASVQLRLLRDTYGPETYAQARQFFIGMQKAHPELASVRVP
jgi:O-antigen ligase